jgi:hypothetical protein
MKRLISLILFLTMVVMLIGCASTGSAGRSASDAGAKGNLTNEVGNSTFVGEHGPGVPYQRTLALQMLDKQP